MSQFERLGFSDAPKPDLDRSIDERIADANRVLATQGRLRHLLDANRSVVEELDLAHVLLRIVEAAVSLVDAKYGALGVIAPDGHLEQFINVGISELDAATIGPLPQGHGLLGAVIDAAGPIRLDHLDRDARSSGVPPHHPKMDGFLGVPIRVRNEVYGNLYLTNRNHGAFTQEDEDLVIALAATAGVAIDNARLFDESRLRQRWSAASADVTSALLSSGSVDAWAVVADRVAAVADADLVCIVVPAHVEGTLTIAAARGGDGAEIEGRSYPAAGTLAGRALLEGRAVTGSEPPVGESSEPRPAIAVPLANPGRSFGAIMITRAPGAHAFTSAEVNMATDFAARATVAMELARGRADSMQLQLVEDRDRIARDLHDHVIQRLFAAGLGLQSLVGRVAPALRDDLGEQVDAVDSAIAEIRTAVFTLSSRTRSSAPRLRGRVLDVVTEITPHLASTPSLTFSGPVDLMIEGELSSDVIAVIREGLTNIARHAGSTESSVDVSIVDDAVLVRIEDNGRGIPPTVERSSGTVNLAERAARNGGAFSLEAGTPSGTVLLWQAPLRAEA